MEVLIAVCLVFSGIYTTTTIVLLWYCWKMSKLLDNSAETLKSTTDRIADEHNNMAKKLIEMQEIMNSHEFKLSGHGVFGVSKK